MIDTKNMKSKYSILKKMLLASPVLVLPAISVVACGSSGGNNTNLKPTKPAKGRLIKPNEADRPMGFFAPYQDVSLATDKANLNTVNKDTGQNNFSLAFLNTASTSAPLTFAGNDWTQVKKKMVDPGKSTKYVVSTGGATGPFAWQYFKDGAKLGDLYYKDLKAEGIHYLDFDIEGYYGNVGVAASAAKQVVADGLKDKYNVEISITLASVPTGLTNASIKPLETFVNAGVTPTVNLMTMDYGTSFTGNMGDYAISAVTAAKGQYDKILKDEQKLTWSDAKLWGHLGCTNMIGANDTTHSSSANIFQVADATKVLNWAEDKNLGFLGIWQASRDHPGPSGKDAATDNSGLPGQADYAFINVFKSFS